MPTTLTPPDVRQLTDDGLPRSEFPASLKADFRVYFAPEAHAAIWKHASEKRSVEVCGVLVGRCERDEDGPFVAVTHTIRCDEATSKFAEVTFTHESWAKINAEMDSQHADRRIVGWYHTHPDFGIFLSDRDTFIHQNFFSNPGQVAHVVDPVRRVEGVFTWQQGRPVACSHFWVGDRIQLDGSGDRAEPPRGPMRAVTAEGIGGETHRRPEPEESLGAVLRMALPLLLAFLLGCLLSWALTGGHSSSGRQQAFVDVLAQTNYWKILKPGLTEKLEAIDRRLDSAGVRLQDLASAHLKLAGDDAEAARKDWTQALNSLGEARELARESRKTYGLTPDEAAALDEILARQIERAAAAAERERERVRKAARDQSDQRSDSRDAEGRSETKQRQPQSSEGARRDSGRQQPAAADGKAGSGDRKSSDRPDSPE